MVKQSSLRTEDGRIAVSSLLKNRPSIIVDVLLAFLLVTLFIIYVGGLFIPLMDNDSAHHALIALNMIEQGDYTQLYFRGEDYLDKPHFLFWITAASFHFFGVSAFAYKLPSLLFSLLGLYATIRLGEMLYDLRTGLVAALILATSYAFILSNNDVRMDAILTASIIFSIWQLLVFVNMKSFTSLLYSALGLSIGFSTKGAIGVAVPLIAALFYILQNRKLNTLLDFRWLALPVLTVIFLIPVFYCFYLQFDLHPEKVIRGFKNISGIQFLLFGQSFERYSGQNWGSANSTDHFFFVHTFLWAFLPWSLLALSAFGNAVINLLKRKYQGGYEPHLFLTVTATVIFLLISGSQFKLPHYLNVLLPLISIVTAAFLVHADNRWKKRISAMQIFSTTMMIIAVTALNTLVFPITKPIILSAAIVLFLLYILILIKAKSQTVLLTLSASVFCYLLMNFSFFPRLMTYQAGNMLADKVKQEKIDLANIYYLEGSIFSNSFDFHVGQTIVWKPLNAAQLKKGTFIYTDEKGKAALAQVGVNAKEVASSYNLSISKLKVITRLHSNSGNFPKHFLLLVNE